jgi:hypothetical protein
LPTAPPSAAKAARKLAQLALSQLALDTAALVWQHRIIVIGSQKQFSLTRAALGTCGSARSEIPISNSVSSVNWSNVTGTNLDDGTTKTLIVNPPAGNRFYRLHKP